MTKLTMTPAAVAAAAKGDLGNAIAASMPGGIEAQEAQGQANLVASFDTLPKDCPREKLEGLGFVFGEDADDIFIRVTPPDGWSLKPTDHSMHNDLLDEQGRKRGGVFYKAAFYDRSANCHLQSRYFINTEYRDDYSERRCVVHDAATGTAAYSGEWMDKPSFEQREAELKKAEDYLNKHHPDWQNVLAYW